MFTLKKKGLARSSFYQKSLLAFYISELFVSSHRDEYAGSSNPRMHLTNLNAIKDGTVFFL
jgi:hypothetical protein